MTTAHINAIGTAVPRHDIHARFIGLADRLLEGDASRRIFRRMAGLAGIEHRWSFLEPADDDDFEAADREGFYRLGAFPGTAQRMERFETQGVKLCEEAVRALGENEDVQSATHLLLVSCTGFVAPGIDQMLIDSFGLDPGLERTAIGFMGCSAAINAIRLANHIVRSEPAARVLMVNIELCSLHLQETRELERLLSGLLFGDGCAAAMISSDARGIALRDFRTVTIPESAHLITWRVGDQGFEMHLSGEVPQRLAKALDVERLRNDRDGILRGEPAESYDLWAVHPGGRTILDAVERGLGLEADALGRSRSVLRDFGNMSSATLMFVLARMVTAGDAGRGVAMAFGPGLVAETFRFDLGDVGKGHG